MGSHGRRLRASGHLHHSAVACPCGATYYVFYAARSYPGQDSYTLRIACPTCAEHSTVVGVAELGGAVWFAAEELPPDFAARYFGDRNLRIAAAWAPGLPLTTRLYVLVGSPLAWLLLLASLVLLLRGC